jgi:membrane-associated phospholipid phosphatase
MRKIAPFHGLTFFFLIGLILLVFFFRGQLPLWRSLLLNYFILMGLLFVIKLMSERKGPGNVLHFIHDFSPLLFVVSIYESLGNLIQYLQSDIDAYLNQVDFFLFGVHPTVWVEQWIVPWLTDVMSFCYVSYYFLPVILVVTLYLRNQTEKLHLSIFVLTFGYYLSFIGYILFPAVGPRYAFTHLQSIPLEGSWLTDWVRDGLNAIEHNQRDCMPSGHTQIALMVLFLAHRYERLLFYLFLPLVTGLILSTIYLRYHYVIDLIVGASFAIGCMIVAPRLYKIWRVKGER